MRAGAPVQGPSDFPEQTPHSIPRPGSTAMLTLPSSWASFVSIALAKMEKDDFLHTGWSCSQALSLLGGIKFVPSLWRATRPCFTKWQ